MTSALLSVLLFQLASSHATGTAAPTSSVGGLTWSVPKSWAEGKGSAMRVATYVAAGAKGDEPAEVAVFYFAKGSGGSVEQNVERWHGQFTAEAGAAKPGSEKKNLSGLAVTLVTAEGTYSSGMMGGGAPKKGYAMRGAIVEGPQGNVFFKMTGPKKTIAAAGAGLDELLKSLKKG